MRNVTTSPEVPIPYRIAALIQERNRLLAYPDVRFAGAIRDARFACTSCGECCTRAVNGYVFVLDREIADLTRTGGTGAYEPAPDPEFCDQNGILYVPGYVLRTRGDAAGSCCFLDGGRCRIYPGRPAACRIYPFMLRRGIDAGGRVRCLTIARQGLHGSNGPEIPEDECRDLARAIREYENAFLSQQIAFLETVLDHFATNGLRHDPRQYRDRILQLRAGKPGPVRVFHGGELREWQDRKNRHREEPG